MANTYTTIHLQIVFAVKHREALIHKNWESQLHAYMAGIIKAYNHKPIIVNGMEDHIHILLGMRPNQSISDLVKLIKVNSSKWINENYFTKKKFEWQGGYGAFSYSLSQLPNIINYIKNQRAHHELVTFRKEYVKILEEFEVDYEEKYTFLDLD